MIYDMGYDRFPVCIAKTQFSFSADAKQYGAVSGFNILIKDVVLNAGAEMIVAIAGDILRMPGLPKDPQANHIDFVAERNMILVSKQLVSYFLCGLKNLQFYR